jgi:hypothetical protein
MRPELTPPQSASFAHPQSPVAGRQCGLAPPHWVWLVNEHSVQVPASSAVSW